ncbi:PucR C-terminal helix-turn-helix domain-containing protein [Lachnospiraceae bacterium]|nr:PucR C-terminal helix-turn-helix domain-containing protein [Lachnospiraceae bacterium]
MAYLSDIIDSLEKKYGIKVHGSRPNRRTTDGIHFFNDNDANIEHLSPNVLYLASFSKYGKCEVYGDVLFTGAHGDTPLSDVFYIDEDIDLIDLFNTCEDAILSYRRIDVEKQNLFSILHNGYGLETLLKTAYKYLNNPIMVCDSSYGILSSFPELNDSQNLEIKNNRLTVRSRYTEDMEQKKITERIYHSVYPFAAKFDDYPYQWIFESIRIKHAVVGYICVRCSERPHTENDLDLVHALAQMVSIQLQKDDSYRNPHGIKYDMFLKELFERYYDETLAVEQLSLLGVKPKAFYCMIICSFTKNTARLMAYHHYIQQLSGIFTNSVTGIFGSRFVTLIPTDTMEPMEPNTLKRLKTFLTMNNMIATVSHVYDSLTESYAYYAQCQGLLSQRLNIFNESPVIYYNDHYLKHILSTLNKTALVSASVNPSIKFMKKHDELNGTNYISTLRTYLKNNRNAPATAAALFIHKSTLFYRFDKMKQLFNIKLDDSDALFSYEYSLRLLDGIKSE